jgi:hypothetical protein
MLIVCLVLQERERGGPVSELFSWKHGRTVKKKLVISTQSEGADPIVGEGVDPIVGEGVDPEPVLFEGVAPKLTKYDSEFKKIHGEDADPYEHPIDERAVILAGNGKKHGRLAILDGMLESTTSLSQVRGSRSSGCPSTGTRRQPRANIADLEVHQCSLFILCWLYIISCQV